MIDHLGKSNLMDISPDGQTFLLWIKHRFIFEPDSQRIFYITIKKKAKEPDNLYWKQDGGNAKVFERYEYIHYQLFRRFFPFSKIDGTLIKKVYEFELYSACSFGLSQTI